MKNLDFGGKLIAGRSNKKLLKDGVKKLVQELRTQREKLLWYELLIFGSENLAKPYPRILSPFIRREHTWALKQYAGIEILQFNS